MRTKILVVLLALALSANLRAQVTIGDLTAPATGALLDLNKTTKGGLLLSNVTLTDLGKIPSNVPNSFPGIVAGSNDETNNDFKGALVYHTGVNGIAAGIYVWNGTNWTPVTENCLPAENLTLTLAASSIAPAVNTPDTFTVSSNASARCAEGESYTWSVSGANSGDFTILSTAGDKASIRFNTAGAYTVRVVAQNSYSTGSAAPAEMTVLAGGVVPVELKTSGYYLTGKPCYDINKTDTYDSRHVATTATARVATSTNLGDATNRTRTYKFYHENYRNLSISLLEDNGGLVKSISQPQSSDQTGVSDYKTFTVTFKDNVETLVTGHGYSVKLLASYTDPIGQSKFADMEISVQDGLCGCPAKISATEWLTFACHNLGGLDILTGTEPFTYTYHGDWYRWGAAVASRKNLSTTTDANPLPAEWTYINTTAPAIPAYQDYDTYQDADWLPANNPCPAGWRLPTNPEFAAAVNKTAENVDLPTENNSLSYPGTWNWSASNKTNFSALLKVGDYLYLPAAAYRYSSDGSLRYRGLHGYYWSSSAQSSYGWYVSFTNGEILMVYSNRAYGLSVRCVAAE
jgi:uncharacterized protein (TIGR02145 family)